ncbi:hypothetical protein OPW36_21000 [Vibrio europaeus]|uniref:Transposase n=1 Tax=Vibrio europaeus TaxID=300876 RepID=A0A178JDS0_9VIBR|nr:hypothetical protein [Vibrio europaeus]MDC5706396.1 hypothetical protein [Vibrio europaeus]MDC5711711.1 hypothetical protein [Vibrio europaeus]MDC5716186.1 hypothetical protein [Vibrio europaeus]MDC5723187.1 hypothetical protein [Vibrio europaeus]MDC5728416.1 hypothetical protein [Vibrio europaeus]
MSRNSEYEQRQKDKGLKKITLWVPEDRDCEVKQAAQMMCDNEDLTINVLRSIRASLSLCLPNKCRHW